MSEQKPLILIVEDDEDMAQLNARLARRNGLDALAAYTAAEARALARDHSPDLFVLDVTLPDGDGLSLCREFRQNSDAPVLFLTGRSETSDKIMGLSSGGDYYLTKPYDKNELIAVIQSLLRRTEQTQKKIDETSVITKGSLTLDLRERKAFVSRKDAGLTLKEFAILLMLVQNEGHELSSDVIYKQVWGADMNIDTGLIRKNISIIKKKLGEERAKDFNIFTEYGKGYTFIAESLNL